MSVTKLPDRRNYSDRTALLCAKLASWSYHEFDTVGLEKLKSNLAREDLKLVDTISRDQSHKILKNIETVDTQAIFVESENNGPCFIVFRGSEPKDLTDWYTDVKFELKSIGDGIKLHKGFLGAYTIVEKEIKKWVKQAEGRPLFLAGHSLGGALAIVTAVKHRKKSFASCYTFGGPRVGAIPAAKVKTPIYRVANYHDPVPDLPPATFVLSDYRHIGDEYILKKDATLPEIITGDGVLDQLNDLVLEAGIFVKSLFGGDVRDAIKDGVKNKIKAHSGELYIKRLNAINKAQNSG